MNAELIEYIKKNYRAGDGARTCLWSEGNCDDVFADGQASGTALTLSDIAALIGLEVEKLHEPEFD